MVGRYKPYPEYFDSGVEWLGMLPSHWEAKRLGSYFEERREKVSDEDYEPLSVTMQGIVPQLENAAKTDAGDNRKLVLKNDFVINSRSDRKGSSGVSNLDGSVSLISTVLTPKNIQPVFAHHLLRSRSFQEEYYRYGKGIVADLWSTNYSEMKNILIPGLPKDEQLKIANFLDYETAKIDTLIEKQQQLIQLLKEKRQAVISHAVTKGLTPSVKLRDSGVEWLGKVPSDWRVVPLKYLVLHKAGIQMGPFGGMLKDLVYDDTGYKLYGQENTISGDFTKGGRWLSHQKYNELLNYQLSVGDIVLTRKGSLGKARLIESLPAPGIIDSDTIRIRVNTTFLSAEYLGFLMHEAHYTAEQITRASRGSVLPGLNSETIGNLQIALPASVDEQEDLISKVNVIRSFYDDALDKCAYKCELLDERRTALISAAVTGKIDVRDWVAPPASPTHKEVAA